MPNYSDQFENFGEMPAHKVADLLQQWADEHEDANYHEYVRPLEALAYRVRNRTSPIQLFVMRSEDLFGTPLAEFYITT